MSILNSIVVQTARAPMITIYGIPGIGKSTLASQFPEPLFILTEANGVEGIKTLPKIQNLKELYVILKDLLKEEKLPFKTLVLDSISKLDPLVTQSVLENSPLVGKEKREAQTLAEAWGGYGAGFEKAAMYHRILKSYFDKFVERGIAVVFISHSEIKKYKSPEFEDYDILSIVMNHDKSRQVYIDDVDAVLYCKLQTFLDTSKDRALIRSSNKHIISACSNATYVSKNRFNIDKDIDMSFEELKKYIPFYNQQEI